MGTFCMGEGEVCVNSVGSYKCNCDDKYTKKDGKCEKIKGTVTLCYCVETRIVPMHQTC